MLAVAVPPYTAGVGSRDSLQTQPLTDRGVPLVEVFRGGLVESVHSIATCVATASGEDLYELGDVDVPYPVRSLAKPFLAVELVRSGSADRFKLGPAEIALAAGSHDGQKQHVQAVVTFLHKLGLSEDALLCGPATEGNIKVGPAIANNCSGKHAAVLALCLNFGLPIQNYLDDLHPVQQWLRPRLFAAFCIDKEPQVMVDGCGMPIFAATLRQTALAFARFGASQDRDIFRVRASMVANPELIGGTRGNLDTEIISATDGAVLAKIGAEGLHGDCIPSANVGFAIKVLDGNSRALGPVIVALLRRFTALPTVFDQRLEQIATRQLYNAGGAHVGVVRALALP